MSIPQVEGSATESTFTFMESDARPLFTIKADGTIVKGEGFTTMDEMSLRFWDMVEASRRPLPPYER